MLGRTPREDEPEVDRPNLPQADPDMPDPDPPPPPFEGALKPERVEES